MKGGAEFRAALAALDLTVLAFSRLLGALGDPRPPVTRNRWAYRLAAAETAAVPGEAVALLGLLARLRRQPLSWSAVLDLPEGPSPAPATGNQP